MSRTPLPGDRLRAFHYRWRGAIGAVPAAALLCSPGTVRFSIAGCVLWLVGGGLRVWTRRYIGDQSREKNWDAGELIVDGPYVRMRHPLYLSNVLIGWGVLLLSGASLGWVLSLGVVWLIHAVRLGQAEDRYQLQHHSVEWWFWAKKTPFWGWNGQPVSRRIYAPGDLPPRRKTTGEAFRSDGWSWLWQLLLFSLLASPLRGGWG